MAFINILFTVCFLKVTTFADRVTWTGSANDNNWFNQTNWENNTLPSLSDNVYISTGSPKITITGPIHIGSLNLSLGTLFFSGTSLTISQMMTLGSSGGLQLSNSKVTSSNITLSGPNSFIIALNSNITSLCILEDGTLQLNNSHMDSVTVMTGATLTVSSSSISTLNVQSTLRTTAVEVSLGLMVQNLWLRDGNITGTPGANNYIWVKNYFYWSGGTLSSNLVVVASNTTFNSGNSENTISGATFQNNGTVTWLSGQISSDNVGSRFVNDGMVQCTNGTNSGSFNVMSGSSYQGSLENYGTINCLGSSYSGVQISSWDVISAGLWNGTLDITGGTLSAFSGTILSSIMLSYSFLFIKNNLSLTVNSISGSGSYIIGNSSNVLNITGQLITSGKVYLQGLIIYITPSSSCRMSSQSFLYVQYDATLINQGTITNMNSPSYLYVQYGATLMNQGNIQITNIISAAYVQYGATLMNQGTITNINNLYIQFSAVFVNQGTLSCNGSTSPIIYLGNGTIINYSLFTIDGVTLYIDDSINDNAAGTFYNLGTITVKNSGRFNFYMSNGNYDTTFYQCGGGLLDLKVTGTESIPTITLPNKVYLDGTIRIFFDTLTLEDNSIGNTGTTLITFQSGLSSIFTGNITLSASPYPLQMCYSLSSGVAYHYNNLPSSRTTCLIPNVIIPTCPAQFSGVKGIGPTPDPPSAPFPPYTPSPPNTGSLKMVVLSIIWVIQFMMVF